MEDVALTKEQILLFIRYEFHQEKSVFDAYRRFCKALGYDAMDYKKFDFWYNRFENGQFDIDYDETKDPKTPELSDMPVDVADKIVKKLDAETKLIFRNVSKKCREIVDKQPFIFNEVTLKESTEHTFLKFDNRSFKYSESPNGNIILAELKEEKRVIEGHSHKICALDKLFSVLEDPKIQFKKFTLKTESDRLRRELGLLLGLLAVHSHQIHVENLIIECLHNEDEDVYQMNNLQTVTMDFLPYLKPGILESIELKCTPNSKNALMKLKDIMETEQWKQAKRLKINFPDEIHYEQHMAHFNYLTARTFYPGDVLSIKETLFNNPNFQRWNFLGDEYEVAEIREVLGGDRFPMANGGTLRVDVSDQEVIFERE